MELFDNLMLGFSVAFTPENLLYALLGCVLGTLIGVLPGIGPVPTIAMLLPITYVLPPVARQAADHNQDEHRDIDAQQLEDQAVDDHGSDHQQDDAPVELVDVGLLGLLGQRAKQHDGAQQCLSLIHI